MAISTAAPGKIARMTPRSLRLSKWANRIAWSLVAAANLGAAIHLLPWLPTQLNTVLVGACVALTVIHTWTKSQAPVRAAFLDGILYERQHAAELPDLPVAVGEGIAPVVKLPRGRHRPSPTRR